MVVTKQNQWKLPCIVVAVVMVLWLWRAGWPLKSGVLRDIIDSTPPVVPIPPNEMHDKWIVITTIQSPTIPIKTLARLPDWKMVVVGDTKTPKNWHVPGVVFLDIEKQKLLPYSIMKLIPYKSYSRKNIGYLYAIQHGAKMIYETDDDNLAEDGMKGFDLVDSTWHLVIKTKNLTYNPYVHFGQSTLWPRGYPLEYLPRNTPHTYSLCKSRKPAVQQGVVNGDPDLDATYRLTRKNDFKKIDVSFDLKAPSVTLPKDTYCAYNCQDTLVTYCAFWSLLLPVTKNMRTLDIYRGYLAQKILWMIGERLAFVATDTYQERNVHSYLKDAADEFDFLKMGKFVELLHKWHCKSSNFYECLIEAYELALKNGFYNKLDVDSAKAWINDLQRIGYQAPKTEAKDLCTESHDSEGIHYYSEEQTTTMFHTPDKIIMQASTGRSIVNDAIVSLCKGRPSDVRFSGQITENRDILLIVDVGRSYESIPMMDAWYRRKTPLILYCGYGSDKVEEYSNKWRVSIIAPPTNKMSSMSGCLYLASKMDYKVKGYMYVNKDMLFPHSSFKMEKNIRRTNTFFKPELKCKDCITVTKDQLQKFSIMMPNLAEFQQSDRQKVKLCLAKTANAIMQMKDFNSEKSVAYYYPNKDNIKVPLVRFMEKYLAEFPATVADLFTVAVSPCIDPNVGNFRPYSFNATVKGDYIYPFNPSSELLSYYCSNVQP